MALYNYDNTNMTADEMVQVLLEKLPEEVRKDFNVVTEEKKPKYYDLLVNDMNKAEVSVIVRKPQNENGKEYIRIWKLGNVHYKLVPTEAAIKKLHKALAEWDGYSSIDLVWDDTLTVEKHEI